MGRIAPSPRRTPSGLARFLGVPRNDIYISDSGPRLSALYPRLLNHVLRSFAAADWTFGLDARFAPAELACCRGRSFADESRLAIRSIPISPTDAGQRDYWSAGGGDWRWAACSVGTLAASSVHRFVGWCLHVHLAAGGDRHVGDAAELCSAAQRTAGGPSETRSGISSQ